MAERGQIRDSVRDNPRPIQDNDGDVGANKDDVRLPPLLALRHRWPSVGARIRHVGQQANLGRSAPTAEVVRIGILQYTAPIQILLAGATDRLAAFMFQARYHEQHVVR